MSTSGPRKPTTDELLTLLAQMVEERAAECDGTSTTIPSLELTQAPHAGQSKSAGSSPRGPESYSFRKTDGTDGTFTLTRGSLDKFEREFLGGADPKKKKRK